MLTQKPDRQGLPRRRNDQWADINERRVGREVIKTFNARPNKIDEENVGGSSMGRRRGWKGEGDKRK